MKYEITKRNFVENILDLEFKDPLLNGYFYAGKKNLASDLCCNDFF